MPLPGHGNHGHGNHGHGNHGHGNHRGTVQRLTTGSKALRTSAPDGVTACREGTLPKYPRTPGQLAPPICTVRSATGLPVRGA
ncbi:hypothetical protein SAM23877_5923 [Streptomyces ambofaciens ATCC 23877]|uniref:Uncharacterized protein n=1 Tax=Streptomyces ambofaciens (strain ATCC 23877 / 3486 / DSM 40053 / JCM 4204 / NBRC 12836 / NRRL B-2516) TaxID=278992 RepID=A0A0K2B179_STRA7|nr:hypothetical protein [Streptomyces ambofaciens]AKZ58968.1 hypothetical protein SAM23877_5923 [Streptomyces ambofaciens ATCC 23877]